MTRFLAPLILFTLAITMSIGAFAASKTESVTLSHQAQLNGITIPAGDYTVKCETNGSSAQVKFMQGRKEVATASGQTKDLGKKAPVTRVVLNTSGGVESIQELDLGGSSTGVVFSSAMANTGE